MQLWQKGLLINSVDQDQIQRILARLMRATTAYQEQIGVIQSIREESVRNSLQSSKSSLNLFNTNAVVSKQEQKSRVNEWVNTVRPDFEDNEQQSSPMIVISPSMLGLLPPSLNASMDQISEASTPRRTETQRKVAEIPISDTVKALNDGDKLEPESPQQNTLDLLPSTNSLINDDLDRWDSFANNEKSQSSITNIREMVTPTFDQEINDSEKIIVGVFASAEQVLGSLDTSIERNEASLQPSREKPFQTQ